MTKKSPRHPSTPPRSAVDPKALFRALVDLFPEAEVERLAKETGFLQRHRKLDPVAFLYTLALEVGPEIERSLEDLRHVYNERTDDPILSYGGFYERFTPELVEFLHQAVLLALARFRHGPGNHLKEKVAHLTDILVQDSTVIRLAAALATVYPATRSRKPAAGVKVATLLSLRNGGPQRLELFGERTSEIDTLKLGPWVKGSLLLMDLGFYKHQGFARVEENGGFFLTRLKDSANPTFVRSNTVHRGRAIDLEGKTWREVAPRLQREALDAEVEIGFSRRGYRGKRSGDTMKTRLVAGWDEEHREYHAYLTNLPVEVLSAEEVAELYRLRWEVELLFREAKGVFKLDRVATKNRSVAESLIWTGWLALLASRRVYNAMREALPPEERVRYPSRRWAKAWARVAHDYLKEVLKHLGREWLMAQPLEELSTRIDARAKDPGITVDKFRREWLA